MIVYDGLKSDFMRSVEGGLIAKEIEQNILDKLGRHTTANEFMSWENSMLRMYMVMNDPEIPSDAGVAIEYNIPQTAKRVDFMISGYGIDQKPGMVIVELKQWQKWKKLKLQMPLWNWLRRIRGMHLDGLCIPHIRRGHTRG